jgi:hypothetical protein
MTYRVDTPQPPPNNRKWQILRANLSRQEALDLMDSLPCARVVRSDGLQMARHDSASRWIMASFCGEPT